MTWNHRASAYNHRDCNCRFCKSFENKVEVTSSVISRDDGMTYFVSGNDPSTGKNCYREFDHEGNLIRILTVAEYNDMLASWEE